MWEIIPFWSIANAERYVADSGPSLYQQLNLCLPSYFILFLKFFLIFNLVDFMGLIIVSNSSLCWSIYALVFNKGAIMNEKILFPHHLYLLLSFIFERKKIELSLEFYKNKLMKVVAAQNSIVPCYNAIPLHHGLLKRNRKN